VNGNFGNLCYDVVHEPEDHKHTGASLGKGEVDSSILSGSTSISAISAGIPASEVPQNDGNKLGTAASPGEIPVKSDSRAVRLRDSETRHRPGPTKAVPQMTPEQATFFWDKVRKSAPDECWLWTGIKSGAKGYGAFWLEGQSYPAHRLAYALVNGPIPAAPSIMHSQVMHSCDNPPCVNPAHLSHGTNKDNILDREAKDRMRTPEYRARMGRGDPRGLGEGAGGGSDRWAACCHHAIHHRYRQAPAGRAGLFRPPGSRGIERRHVDALPSPSPRCPAEEKPRPRL
jgi:hypothetical protein